MRYALLFLIAALTPNIVVAQKAGKATKTYRPMHVSKARDCIVQLQMPPEVFTYVEQRPEFRGGSAELNKYLDNALYYPARARDEGVAGKVLVRFMVNEDGSINNVKVIKGIGYGCDEVAVKVVSAMPPWHPGKKNGKAVKTVFVLPIVFKIM